MENYIEQNMAKLREIRAKNPSATHVYIRRWNKDKLIVDIPISHADFTIRNNPAWELVSSNKQMDDDIEALFDGDDHLPTPPPGSSGDGGVALPPKPSEETMQSEAETMQNTAQTALLPGIEPAPPKKPRTKRIKK